MKNKKESFASVAEKLARKEAKYEKMLNEATTDRARNTAEIMLSRVQKKREMLMQDNEQTRLEKEGLPEQDMYANGSYVDPPSKNPFSFDQLVRNRMSNAGAFSGDLSFLENAPQAPTLEPFSSFIQNGSSSNRGAQQTASRAPLPKVTPVQHPKRIEPDSILDKIQPGISPVPTYDNVGTPTEDALMQSTGSNGMDFLGKAAPFIDNVAMAKYIKNVKGDARPEEFVGANLATEYDINPELIEARKGQRVLNSSLDQSNTNRGASNNMKVAGFAERLKNTNRLQGVKKNQEIQMRNAAALERKSTANTNTQLRNQHSQNQVDFQNQKAYMKYANALNVGEDLGEINSQRLRQMEQERMLKAMRPYWNRFNLDDKYGISNT